jgi:hypothetical protein
VIRWLYLPAPSSVTTMFPVASRTTSGVTAGRYGSAQAVIGPGDIACPVGFADGVVGSAERDE